VDDFHFENGWRVFEAAMSTVARWRTPSTSDGTDVAERERAAVDDLRTHLHNGGLAYADVSPARLP